MSLDLVGRELTEQEQALLDVYHRLKALAANEAAAPCVVAAARHALAAIAQPVNDLGLVFEHLLDVGV